MHTNASNFNFNVKCTDLSGMDKKQGLKCKFGGKLIKLNFFRFSDLADWRTSCDILQKLHLFLKKYYQRNNNFFSLL